MKHIFYNYNGKNVYLKATTYQADGSLAITMNTRNGKLYSVLTVNLGMPIDSPLAFVDTNNNPNIEEFIKSNGLGTPNGYTQRSGFCTYPLYEFNLEKMK